MHIILNDQLSFFSLEDFSSLGPNFSLLTSAKMPNQFLLLEVHCKSIVSAYFKDNNYNSIASIS